jgi:prepilin-type N-terminal cleavage/methylation domain-containing protein
MFTHNRGADRAYTLLEIVIVIAILAIVSAIAIPQFGPRDDLKTASAAREIIADLLYAQSQAITTGKTHYVAFDPDGGYRVMDSVVPPHVLLHPASRTPYEIRFASGPLSGVVAERIDFDGAVILAFDSTGAPGAYSAGTATLSPLMRGAIVLTSGQSTLTLTIEPFTGAINIH